MFSAPQLRIVNFKDSYLNPGEVVELLALLQQKRILHNLESMVWYNFTEMMGQPPWAADEALFELFLDTLEINFTHIEPIRPPEG